ncbi:non-ribosomal peptide synthetase [Streptomyces actinomycinicus]|uniref:Non-ribosomal peptide synthetase n=1 Tax=Streptomyces actinomycinicus TaxID=1695166 RepID=A0A937EGZ1_9ACTN|nr:non-ribosomal peptide synthetase [Streptomyces actinomycinicus]MBL1082328.1 non-ribosomal peptide synthetase [Streptomyces actinomycinicus]
MSSENAPRTTPAPTPTPLRARLTEAGRSGRAELLEELTPAARQGLHRVAGDRPLEELVVLTAAAALVLRAAEDATEPVLAVAGPRGTTVCPVPTPEDAALRDLVLAVDTALRRADAPAADDPALPFALLLRSDRLPPVPYAETALVVSLRQTSDGGRALHAAFDTRRLDAWWAAVVLRSLVTVLAAFGEPGTACADVELSAPDDRAQVARWERAGFVPEPSAGTLLEPVLERMRTTPDAVAVIDRDEPVSYAELAAGAETVARRLVEAGVRPGDRVATALPKSTAAVTVILGILRAAAAYVPLDPGLPPERLRFILDDAACAAVVTGDPGPLAGSPVPVLTADALTGATATGAPADLPAPPGPDDLAYVIYTSGSTGTPKGVAVRHSAIAGYLAWKRRYHALDAETRLVQVPSFSFDSSVSDLFSVLGAGGTLLLLPESDRLVPQRVGNLVRRHRATHITLVPSLYRVLLEALAAPGCLRLVTVAGEACPAELVAHHFRQLPGVRLVNEYGPTENSVGATAYDCTDEPRHGFPVGRPIDTTVLEVLDERGRPLPPGFPGEINLAGPALAEGYVNDPDLTERLFVKAPRLPGGRRYRTGDRGWWTPAGVEFLGRGDSQVKIRGHRVELGDVEAGLCSLPGVASAVAVAAPGADGSLVLVGFLDGDADPDEVRAQARRILPGHMVPARVERLDGMPLTRNGKVDRAALARRSEELLRGPAPQDAHESSLPGAQEATDAPDAQASADGLAPQASADGPAAPAGAGDPAPDAAAGGLATRVAGLFAEVLGVSAVGPQDDFFDLGGHSLAAALLIVELENRFGLQVELDDFFDEPTVAAVCRAAAAARS